MAEAAARGGWRAWLAAALAAFLPLAQAAVLRLDEAPGGPVGMWAEQMREAGQPLDVAAASALAREGRFRPSARAVPDFGIDAGPVWLHLSLENPAATPLPRRLLVGTAWIDALDVYLLREGAVSARWSAGDAEASRQHPVPGSGYVFDHAFEPGRTELFVRAATPDPLAIPVRILAPGEARTWEHLQNYSYGFLYGFLVALLAYNALLYAGLRERSHLDYSVYLALFVALNIAYTGHGYAWLWPDATGFERYVILALMVLFGASGLRFATGFLDLDRLAPRAALVTRLYSYAGLGLMAAAMAAGRQGIAALVAFVFTVVYAVGMVGLGMLGLRLRQESAHYFLAAALCAMIGATATTLAVWGVVPFTTVTYRAVELGVLLEATLLALALAQQVRLHRRARRTAEQLASTDPLTGLLNRRAFVDQGENLWSVAVRNDRPVALVLLDLDHFKSINDEHGHAAGDRALRQAAALLRDASRRGDLAARWGGEEFILLLPETTLAQAMAYAERLRSRIAASDFDAGARSFRMSASLGVAERGGLESLQALVDEADARLYLAKKEGRDRVRGP